MILDLFLISRVHLYPLPKSSSLFKAHDIYGPQFPFPQNGAHGYGRQFYNCIFHRTDEGADRIGDMHMETVIPLGDW